MVETENSDNIWHLMGRWNEGILFGSMWLDLSESRIYRDLGLDENLRGDFQTLDGYHCVLKSDLKWFGRTMESEFSIKNGFLSKVFSICGEEIQKLQTLSIKENLENVLAQSVQCISCCELIHMCDDSSMNFLENIAKENEISFDQLISLMHPNKKTLLTQYQDDLTELDLNNREDVKNLLIKYSWVGTHAFSGIGLTVQKIEQDKAALTNNRHVFVDGDAFPEKLKALINNGSQLSYYRSYIVEQTDKSLFAVRQLLLNKLAENNFPLDRLKFLTFPELLENIRTGKTPDDFTERYDPTGIRFINKKWQIVPGSHLRDLINEFLPIHDPSIMQVSGNIAFQGKVTGKARIIEHLSDISKIESGDVIVAAETTPDYILGMRKAAAFVTNQGGITSHAAIIAREMKKPCIIGTKNATQVFKNGDLIEVDAYSGIVKKLS